MFCGSREEGLLVARRIHTGMMGVNGRFGGFDAMPFGGINSSGVGYQGGADGLLQYTDLRSITSHI